MGENNYQNMLNRLIEEKYTFTYKKLVVPMSMRSPYWKYFGFPATEDGNILTKVKIICVLCKTQIAYNKNTSNLRMHLQNRHANELAELVSVHPPENRPSVKVQRSESHHMKSHGSSSGGGEHKSPRKRKFHRMLENTNSGFIKQGGVYATPVDGSIEIEGDLQFISDPTINIASFADEEFSGQVPSIQILNSTPSSAPVVVVENSASQAQHPAPAPTQPSNRIRIEGTGADGITPFELELKPAPSSAGVGVRMPRLSHLSQMSSVESKSVCDAITDMVVTDLTPPDIVEKPGFQRLVATLRSPCEIPSTQRLLTEILPQLHSQVKDSCRAALAEHQDNVGLSLEEWTSREGNTMVTMSVHFLHKSSTKLESRVLGTLHSPYDLTHNWATDVDAVLADWQIEPARVTAVIAATGQQNLLDTFTAKGITVVPCLLHTIQVVARMCFERAEVSLLLGKVRALLNAFKRDLDDESTLRIQDQEFHLEEPLVLDYPPVWLTTYHMIEQIQMFRTLIPTVLESGSENLKEFWLLDEDWDLLEELLAVMEPLRVAVLTLSEERVPLLSLLEPLLWQLVDSHLQIKDDDSVFVQGLKRTLSDELTKRYSDYNCKLVLRSATQLDPRFKSLPHTDESIKNTVTEEIHKALESNIGDDVSQKEIVPTPSKKNRLSGLLGKLCPDKSSSERAKNELEHFKSVSSAALDACPLEWWAGNAAVCPSLGKVARRYLCLLACATPLHRIPHPQQSAFHQSRRILAHDLADTLLFLNANYSR